MEYLTKAAFKNRDVKFKRKRSNVKNMFCSVSYQKNTDSAQHIIILN